MAADQSIRALGKLYELANDLGDEALRDAVNDCGSALVSGQPIQGSSRWAVADAVMGLVSGPNALHWPVIDRAGGEWAEDDVEAALVLLEEVAK